MRVSSRSNLPTSRLFRWLLSWFVRSRLWFRFHAITNSILDGWAMTTVWAVEKFLAELRVSSSKNPVFRNLKLSKNCQKTASSGTFLQWVGSRHNGVSYLVTPHPQPPTPSQNILHQQACMKIIYLGSGGRPIDHSFFFLTPTLLFVQWETPEDFFNLLSGDYYSILLNGQEKQSIRPISRGSRQILNF